MRRFGLVLIAAMLCGMGYAIGARMSAEAMAVVVGVALGVAATIPTALIIIMALGRNDERQAPPPPQYPTYPTPRAMLPSGRVYEWDARLNAWVELEDGR